MDDHTSWGANTAHSCRNRRQDWADVEQVMGKIREQGFYLQMPPPPDEDLFMADGHPDKPAGRDA